MQTSSGHENTMTSSLGSFEGRGLTFQGLLYLLICILFLVNSADPEKPGDLKEAYNICDIETRVSLTMAAKNGMSEQEDKACSPCMGKNILKKVIVQCVVQLFVVCNRCFQKKSCPSLKWLLWSFSSRPLLAV